MFKNKIILIALLIGFSSNVYSQEDNSWLYETVKGVAINQLTDYVEGKVGDMVDDEVTQTFPNANPIEKYIGTTAIMSLLLEKNMFSWSGFGGVMLDFMEASNFEEEAQKLKEWQYDKNKLSETDVKYGIYDITTAYSGMPAKLIQTTQDIAHQYNKTSLENMGNGQMTNHFSSLITNSRDSYYVDELSDIYSSQAISIINNKYPHLIKPLIDHANNDKKLAMLINLNPELYLDFYNKTSQQIDLCNNRIQIVYWTETFNHKDVRLPNDVYFAQYDELSFVDNTIMANGELIATVHNNRTRICSPDIFNHNLIPNAILDYDLASITTDVLGRPININTYLKKGKNKTPTIFKKNKKFLAAINNDKTKMVFYLIPKKYQGINCLANAVVIDKDKQNKQTIKAINKNIKKSTDGAYNVSIYYKYNEQRVIEIRVNGNKFAIQGN